MDDDSKVAIKSFSKNKINKHYLGIQVIYNEIKLLRMINCNNIIKIITAYEEQNVINIVFEYMELSLKKILQKQCLGAEQINHYMKDLLVGLNQLHNKNIIHRDLKPDNIIFRKRYEDSDIVIWIWVLLQLLTKKDLIFKKIWYSWLYCSLNSQYGRYKLQM